MLKSIKERLADIRPAPRIISAMEAKKEMSNNQGLLIDVREPAEVHDHAVKDSVNYPRGLLEMKLIDSVKDAETPIYIHCASGVRAILAAEQLMKMGYMEVAAIKGSIEDVKLAFDSNSSQ